MENGSFCDVCCVITVLHSFFFSSRRRHTRCSRDWSSDVCSSDLSQVVVTELWIQGLAVSSQKFGDALLHLGFLVVVTQAVPRSEERRVGKECRSRWSPYN